MDGVTNLARASAIMTATTVMLLASSGAQAQAQATAPAKPASAAGGDQMVGNTPSEALQRQALSPYRFIMNVAPVKLSKPAAATAPAPTPPPAPAVTAKQAAPSPAPTVAKTAAPGPATTPEVAKAAAPSTAVGPTAPPAPVAAAAAVASTLPPTTTAAQPAAIQVAAAANTAATPLARALAAPLPAPVVVARTELVAIQQDPPTLSNALLNEISQGRVKVRFDVNPDGSTSGVQVASSSHRKLNALAVAAVSKWRFQPIDVTRSAEIEMSFNNDVR